MDEKYLSINEAIVKILTYVQFVHSSLKVLRHLISRFNMWPKQYVI